MSESIRLGRFVWYELLTTDPDAVQAFYTSLIGWTTQPFDGGPTPYTMWVNKGTPLGGLMQLPDEAQQQGAPPHWLPYVSTPDVDKTLEDARTKGGKVLMGPMDIPTVGRVGVLADPQGGVLAAFTPAGEAPGNPGAQGVGEFTWHELATTDLDAAFDFYSTLFGWVKTDVMDMGEAGPYQMYGLSTDEPPLGGMFNKPKEMPAPGWVLYISVDSVDAKVEQIKTLGGQVISGPMDVPGGDRIVQCIDPRGATIALHSKKPPA